MLHHHSCISLSCKRTPVVFMLTLLYAFTHGNRSQALRPGKWISGDKLSLGDISIANFLSMLRSGFWKGGCGPAECAYGCMECRHSAVYDSCSHACTRAVGNSAPGSALYDCCVQTASKRSACHVITVTPRLPARVPSMCTRMCTTHMCTPPCRHAHDSTPARKQPMPKQASPQTSCPSSPHSRPSGTSLPASQRWLLTMQPPQMTCAKQATLQTWMLNSSMLPRLPRLLPQITWPRCTGEDQASLLVCMLRLHHAPVVLISCCRWCCVYV